MSSKQKKSIQPNEGNLKKNNPMFEGRFNTMAMFVMTFDKD